jgi:hypothetical protein
VGEIRVTAGLKNSAAVNVCSEESDYPSSAKSRNAQAWCPLFLDTCHRAIMPFLIRTLLNRSKAVFRSCFGCFTAEGGVIQYVSAEARRQGKESH